MFAKIHLTCGCSVKGKRVITFEGERTVQDIVQFAEKANRLVQSGV